MGAITTILPLVLEAFKLVPSLVAAGQQVYDGAKQIWAGVTSEDAPTPEQQAEYDAAEQAAFNALMESTKDVAEEGDLKR
jgi:hypothetical protein